MTGRRLRSDRVRRLLLVNLGGAGDLLLSTPFFREARRLFPRARITLLAAARSAPVLEGNPRLDEVVTLPGTGAGDLLRDPAAFLRPLAALRRARFDLAVNLLPLATPAGALKIRALLAFVAPRAAAGLDTEGRGRFLDLAVPDADVKRHTAVDVTLSIAGALGGRTDLRELEMPLPAEARAEAESLLEGLPRPRIGLHPGANLETHRWPADRFAGAAARLARMHPAAGFVVTGSASERALAEEVAARSGIPPDRIRVAAGRTSPAGFPALLARLDLFISNDTGAIHFAAAVDAPLVAIFGPGDHVRFRPVTRSGRVRLVRRGAPCAPCARARCERMECLLPLTVDDVVSAAAELLPPAPAGADRKGAPPCAP